MAKCKNCINLQKLIDENNVTVENWCFEKRDCVDVESDRKCKHFIVKTNADRIRTMSDDELAEFLLNVNTSYEDSCVVNCKWEDYPTHDKGCKDCFLEYLKSEVK